LRLESALNIEIIFPVLFGAALLGIAIGGWKRHEHCKLIAKGLTALLTLNHPGEETSNESLKRDAAKKGLLP
jgi:hypothetical protein